jgi:tRNA (adenine37-N6)-methyltransferase
MQEYTVRPLAWVRNARTHPVDDDWDAVESELELAEGIPEECVAGLDTFSHVEVIYLFDRVTEADVIWTARHPRNNTAWPKVGILAQRGKNRPNRLGVAVAPLLALSGRVLRVRGLDAIDGTPVLDIKPVLREFLPRGEVRQPTWATELMRGYWRC